MPSYYLDIETTGLNPQRDKIITIQYQQLNKNTAEPIGELVILKEWQLTEHGILQKFINDSRITDDYPFSFVPVGYNLGFEHNFFKERTATYGLPAIDILTKPFLDLRVCGIIMNSCCQAWLVTVDNVLGSSKVVAHGRAGEDTVALIGFPANFIGVFNYWSIGCARVRMAIFSLSAGMLI